MVVRRVDGDPRWLLTELAAQYAFAHFVALPTLV
jgi:hypothetical protein